MSLKSFHIFFIVVCVSLMLFTGAWSGQSALAGQDHVGLLVASILGFAASLAYLAWFLRRYKALS